MPIVENLYYHLYQEHLVGKSAVILLHGAGGNYLSWPPEMRRLSGFRVYALDLPGHGKSSGHGHQSISAYADAIKKWMEAITLNQVVLVGHSMGSAIALTLALDDNDRISGLILIGCGARLRVSPVLLEDSASITTFQTSIDTIMKWSFSLQASKRLVELTANRMAEIRPSVLHGDLVACDSFDLTDQLEKITQPSLILCGEEDKMTPLSLSRQLASTIRNATLQVVPEAGHMVVLEQPKIVASAVIQFLEGLSG